MSGIIARFFGVVLLGLGAVVLSANLANPGRWFYAYLAMTVVSAALWHSSTGRFWFATSGAVATSVALSLAPTGCTVRAGFDLLLVAPVATLAIFVTIAVGLALRSLRKPVVNAGARSEAPAAGTADEASAGPSNVAIAQGPSRSRPFPWVTAVAALIAFLACLIVLAIPGLGLNFLFIASYRIFAVIGTIFPFLIPAVVLLLAIRSIRRDEKRRKKQEASGGQHNGPPTDGED